MSNRKPLAAEVWGLPSGSVYLIVYDYDTANPLRAVRIASTPDPEEQETVFARTNSIAADALFKEDKGRRLARTLHEYFAKLAQGVTP